MKPDDNRWPDRRAGPTPREPDYGELAEVESLLREMPLAGPSGRLEAKMSSALTRPGAQARLRSAWVAAAAAIALAIGTMPLLLHHDRAPSTGDRVPGAVAAVGVAIPMPRPLRIERDAVRVADKGIVAFAGSVPVRGYRCQSLRQIWYFDPKQHKQLCVTIPADRLVLLPVRAF